ncbi:AAA domain-containing protein [Flagelloscypha sp. PMI_526]|nr:AAA domain-containing protein [Flagelloscypha sp. PMI_526]
MLRAEKTKLISEQKALQDNSARHQSLSDQIRRAMGRETELRNQNQSLAELIRKEGRDLDRSRRQEAQRVLNSVSVVCSTLSGAGHPQLDPLEFDTVIIDEAAQAIELSSLIPLKFNASRYVLVGDPQQLAPTVISSKVCLIINISCQDPDYCFPRPQDAGYNQSLFVRLQRQNPDSAHLLSIQYRMHPEISCLPSALFYAGRLGDGPGLAQSTARPWHSNPRFGPYRFYNINGGREENVGHSHKNVAEINAAMALYDRLHREHSSHDFTSKIGIITMYRTQLLELRKAFSLRFGRTIRETIDFNTVDGFQGQEKDIIILSCVRAGPSTTNIGFLAGMFPQKSNVCVTDIVFRHKADECCFNSS